MSNVAETRAELAEEIKRLIQVCLLCAQGVGASEAFGGHKLVSGRKLIAQKFDQLVSLIDQLAATPEQPEAPKSS